MSRLKRRRTEWGSVVDAILLDGELPGGAIFEKLRRFENAVDSDAVELLPCKLLLFAYTPAVVVARDASMDAMRDLLLAFGRILRPWARFTCRPMPSGAII